MKVFISWSGEQSRQIALALYEWLPQTVHAAKPYMSEKDNEAGGLWDHILASALEESNFGIVCLTPRNLESPWLNFEAGALSKAVTQARVVPLLYGLSNNDVGLPLSRFMMKAADKEGMWETVATMNNHVEKDRRLEDNVLAGTFESLWPKLEEKLNAVPAGPEARRRPDRELLEELLELVRANIGFVNATPSASGPGNLSGDARSLETLFASGSSDLSEAVIAPYPAIPRKIVERMRRIAGPNGLIMTNAAGVTIQSPRVGADDFTSEEMMFLDTTREFLTGMGMDLNYAYVRPDTPSEY